MVFFRRPRSALGFASVAAVFVLIVGSTLTSCTAAPPTSEPLPGGVAVAVFQNRTDYTPRRLQVAVTNDTDQDLTVTGLTFTSNQFVEPAVWAKDFTTIRAGLTVNLPVSLPAANCDAKNPTPRVELEYRLPGESERTGFVTPEDTLDQLAPLLAKDCFVEAVGRRVDISIDAAPRVTARSGFLVAELDVQLSPAGSTGSVTVVSARGTTLLAPWDPVSLGRLPSQSLGITVGARGPAITATLTVVPNRCDAHAIAEDKLGTVIPLDITLEDGSSGVVTVASPDEVRAALYAFVQDACGAG